MIALIKVTYLNQRESTTMNIKTKNHNGHVQL